MTDVDESLLTAAKLHEQIRGDLDGGNAVHSFGGLVDDADDLSSLSFVEDAIATSDVDEFPGATALEDTALGSVLLSSYATEAASRAVHDADAELMTHLVGVTDTELTGSSIRLPLALNEQLANNDAPAFVLGAGNPNTGKTNTMSLLAKIRKAAVDDLLVVSNIRSWELADRVATSAHDLAVTLLEVRDRPKFVVIDEASTHFDSRTYRHDVATQWTPNAKRFAKIGVDTAGLVVHTGKDCHPEVKHLATLAFYKHAKQEAEFFARWPAEVDAPADQLFGGPVDDLEVTTASYDPDDEASWAWNLEPELFTLDCDWSELLTELRDRGPAPT